MAGSFGDLVLDLMGQPDPRRNLAAAINQGIGMGQPAPAANGGQVGGGLASMAQGGEGPDQQNPPPAQAQQQPQAYQSPPDIASTLFELQRRQNSAESINRGLGLLLGGFARPEDRAPMLQAMTGLSGGGGAGGSGSMDDIVKLYGSIQSMQAYRAQLLHAPVYAKQLGIPVEQVAAYIQAGKLPEIMQAVNQKQMELRDPLHQAQVLAAQAGTAKTTAETGAIPGQIAKTAAETQAIPGQIAKTEAETQAIPGQIAKTAAETAAIPSTTARTVAETQQAQAQTEKLAAEAQARQNLAALAKDPNFVQKYGITPEAAAALPPDDLAKLVATPPQTATEVAAKTQAGAKVQLDSLRGDYDKQAALIDDITKSPVLDEITGKVAGRLPSSIAPWLSGQANSQEAINLQQKVDQLSHMGFLAGAHAVREAVGARVSNVEAMAGNEAQTRLHDQTQSATSYRAAIQQVKDESDRNMAIAYKQAGVPIPDDLPDVKKAAAKLLQSSPAPSSPAPTTNAPSVKRRNYDAQGNLVQ